MHPRPSRSITNAIYTKPRHVATYIRADTHNWLGRVALKSRCRDPPVQFDASQSVEAPEEAQVLPAGQGLIHGHLLRHQAHGPPGIGVERLAVQSDRAGVPGQQADDVVHGGGLAGPCAPQQAT